MRAQLLFILALVASVAMGQAENKSITLTAIDAPDFSFDEIEFYFDSSGINSISGAQKAIEDYVQLLRIEGYPLANLDSISHSPDGYLGWLFVGDKTERASVRIMYSNDSDRVIANQLLPNHLIGDDILLSDVSKYLIDLVEAGERNGYPFTQSRIKRGYKENGFLRLDVEIDFGPQIDFGELEITGYRNVKTDFLAAHLDIREGDPFNQSRISSIPERIEQLQFLKLDTTPIVRFENTQAIVELETAFVKSNRFDAIIGILPNSRDDNKLLITGVLDLSLNNLFKSGKQLSLFWNGYQVQSQTLDLEYVHPNLLQSNAGLIFEFSLLKQDSAFTRRQLNVGLNFKPNETSQMSVFSNWQSSVVLNDIIAESTPTISDYSGIYFGLLLESANTNPLSPSSRKRFRYFIETSFGSKTVIDNLTSAENKTNQFSARAGAEYLKTIFGSTAIYVTGSAGHIENSQRLLNDQFRLGGLKSIRGFNDNEFFASTYAIARLEPRAYFNANSYFLLFYDQAYLDLRVDGEQEDYPFGIGLGMTLSTGTGQFSLVYALGKSKIQNISISDSRIHFGYIAVF